MENLDFKMGNRLLELSEAEEPAPARRGDLQSWWGSRWGVSGKAVLTRMAEAGLVEDFNTEIESRPCLRIRLTPAGIEAVKAEREARSKSQAGQAA